MCKVFVGQDQLQGRHDCTHPLQFKICWCTPTGLLVARGAAVDATSCHGACCMGLQGVGPGYYLAWFWFTLCLSSGCLVFTLVLINKAHQSSLPVCLGKQFTGRDTRLKQNGLISVELGLKSTVVTASSPLERKAIFRVSWENEGSFPQSRWKGRGPICVQMFAIRENTDGVYFSVCIWIAVCTEQQWYLLSVQK